MDNHPKLRKHLKQNLILELMKGVELYLSLSMISDQAGAYYSSSKYYLENFISLLKKTSILEAQSLYDTAEFFVEVMLYLKKMKEHKESIVTNSLDATEKSILLKAKTDFLLESGGEFFDDTPYIFEITNNCGLFPSALLRLDEKVIHIFPFWVEYSEEEIKDTCLRIEDHYVANFSNLEEICTKDNYSLYYNFEREEYEIWDGLEKIMARPVSKDCDEDLDLESALSQLESM